MSIVELPKDILDIFQMFEDFSAEVWLVGGSVRDLILGKEPKDYDFATNLYPDKVIENFRKLDLDVIETGLKHGTVTVVYRKNNYEVTTYRIESDYSDNRRPDNVYFTSSIYQDLSRRDFTINAIAYNPKFGFKDYFGGINDLKNKIIKAVGNPNIRFAEDALRILRAVRFASQLNFDIESKTYASLVSSNKGLLIISKERIREELCKILLSQNPAKGLRLLRDLSLMEYIIPEIVSSFNFDQKNPHHDKDVYEHTISVVENTEQDLILRLAALLHDIAKPYCMTIDFNGIGHFYKHHQDGAVFAKKILTDLRFDNDTISSVECLVYEHMSKFDTNPKDSTIKKLINRVGIKNLEKLFNLQRADILASAPPHDIEKINTIEQRCKHILNTKQPLLIRDLAIDGKDIMSLGISQGPIIGEILNNILTIVLENPDLNNKSILAQHQKRHLTPKSCKNN